MVTNYLKNEENLEGKVVKSVHINSEYMSIIFEDDTALLIRAERNPYEEDDCTLDTFDKIDSLMPYEIQRLGLGTQEEVNELAKQRSERDKAFCEQRDREHYERLKKKFEGA